MAKPPEQEESPPPAEGRTDPSDVIPQLAHEGITSAELQTAVRVLHAVAKLNHRGKKRHQSSAESNGQQGDGLELYKHSNLRPLRKELAACLDLHQRTMFQGKSEEDHYEQKKLERSVKRQKMAERSLHKKYIADTALRKGRVERLNQFKEDAKDEEEARLNAMMAMMVPDGHVDTLAIEQQQQHAGQTKLLTNQADQQAPSTNTAAATITDSNGTAEPIQLPKLRSCYVCKVRYRELHHFYDQLCPACAALNWEKRHQTANMENKVAVVTGSRVKIGYQTCLKLLRAGATVVATTRFPNAAVEVYRREADFESWRHRLQIYGLDLRDVTGLEAFTRFLKIIFSQGIDVLINNACQTIRRPRGYYVPMVEKEQALWRNSDEVHQSLLGGCRRFEHLRQHLHHQHHGGSQSSSQVALEAATSGAPLLLMGMEATEDPKQTKTSALTLTMKQNGGQMSNGNGEPALPSPTFDDTGLSHSAAMSQTIILPEDVGVSDSILPPGLTDINGQQLDLRTSNSWLLKMEEVSTPEVMECMFINAIAPFVLNSRLKPIMTTPQDDKVRPDRFIINVSAMEGKFYRYKMANHPHTNMAKAALNMLTRTSAEDLANNHRIFMNSVDTGWINDENPLEKASKIAATNLFQTPIDEIDAASRILEPIFSGINGGREMEKDYGKFLKDYRETEW